MKLNKREIDLLLLDYYQNKLTIKDCIPKYKISKSTISKILKTFGIGGRKRVDYNNNLYTCEESFFEKIDCHEKAYWFGFICADGNIYNGKLQIGLHKKDSMHLKKFCERIKYNGPLYNDRDCVKLIISRKKIVEDLRLLGISENKTHLIDQSIFDKIPKKFLKSALLGYIDGDGSFSIKKYGIIFNLLGNCSFLEWVIDFFKDFGLKISEPKKDKRTKSTFYCSKFLQGKNLAIFLNCIYTNGSQDFLERKRIKLNYERQPT
jgi:hypothetical protein